MLSYLPATPAETFDAAAEAAAFRKLHNIQAAIASLKAQNLPAAVAEMLPFLRQALDEYRAAGASDPDYLSRSEALYLEAADFVQRAGGGVRDVSVGLIQASINAIAEALGPVGWAVLIGLAVLVVWFLLR